MQNNANKPGKTFFLQNLKWYEHLAAGWPLFLMFSGGAVGGGCGGAAYVINGKIFSSKLSQPLKYVYSFLVGIAAVILYIIAAVVFKRFFHN